MEKCRWHLADAHHDPWRVSLTANSLTMKSILLVDDDEDNRQITCWNLRKEFPTIQITQAESGEQALEILGSLHFDAIITDWKMPGLGGAEFIATLRSMDEHIPIIVLSLMDKISQVAIAAGATYVVPIADWSKIGPFMKDILEVHVSPNR